MAAAEEVDAVVVGGGVNGLVAAATLADRGWDVVLLEAHDVGGAVRSQQRGDAVVDLFSAFYPLSAGSPVLQRLELESHGLRWRRADAVVAQPMSADDDRGAVLEHDPHRTAAGLDAWHAGDGDRWLELFAEWKRLRGPLIDALLGPWPPLGAAARLARAMGVAGAPRTARMLALPATRLGEELFGGEAARQLIVGNSQHADIPPNAAGSGAFGWLLCMLGQDVGFPVPEGGAGQLSVALARRARAAGARVEEHVPVESVEVRGGRAVGVRTSDGRKIRARRGVLAALDVEVLLNHLVGHSHLPRSAVDDLHRFERDLPTLKVNWVLPHAVPWRASAARRAGTVHVGRTVGPSVRWAADLDSGRTPDDPFLLTGQMATADPSRAPAGHEVLWAYTHLPRSFVHADAATVDRVAREHVQRVTEVIERYAPGALDGAYDNFVQTPHDLQDADASLVHGALNGGTAQLHQQLVLRPLPGTWGPRLPIEGLYLASASAHPGGGVHGSCGHNAAVAALHDAGLRGRLTAPVRRAARRRLFPDRPVGPPIR
ncbi:MAG: phytoene desaturase family protein [Angustibacter sp.]